MVGELSTSVVIASYRRADYLRQCLRSLLAQTRMPDQIVVVVRPDDKATQAVVQELSAGADGLVWTTAFVDRDGVVPAENAGLEASLGDVLCFIDDDGEADRHWIQRIIEHYRDPRVGAVGGPVIPMADGQPLLEHTKGWYKTLWFGWNAGSTETIPSQVVAANALRGCNMSVRRSCAEMFDVNLRGGCRFEDDQILTLIGKGMQVLCDPDILVYHHEAPRHEQTKRGILDELSSRSSQHNNTYVHLKHHRLPSQFAFLIFTFLIGDPHYPGLAMFLAYILWKRKLGVVPFMPAAFLGKVDGVSTYLGWRRNRTSAHRRDH